MATINSNGSGGGNWSAAASWSGGVVPVEGDKVNIVSGDTITVDGTYVAGDDTSTAINVKDGGILKASRSANSELSVKGDLQIENNGELDYGKSTSIIPASYTAKIRANYSASLSDGKYGIMVNYGAKCFVYGSTRTTNTYSTNDLAVSGTSIDVNDVTGWVVGDVIVIGTTEAGYKKHTDEKTISAITGNTITLSSGVSYVHYKGARVSNMTKNVVFEAYNSSYPAYLELRTSTGTPNVAGEREIQQLSLRYFGDTAHAYKYGAMEFIGGNNGMEGLYASIGNIAIYKGDYAGFVSYGSKPIAWEIDDSVVFNTNSSGAYLMAGGTMTFNNFHVYHCTIGANSSYSQGGVNITFNDSWFVGNTNGLRLSAGNWFVFNRCNFLSHQTVVYTGDGATCTLNDCNLGLITDDYDASCQYMIRPLTNGSMKTVINDSYFNYSTAMITGRSNANEKWIVYISNKDVDPSAQEIYSLAGTFYRDNTTYKTGVASLRAEPESASYKLSNTWQIFAPTDELVVVSGYLRKNAAYGNTFLPKVTLSGLGITESTYTMTDVDDEWEQFTVSGTQTTGTDGILTLKVEFMSSGSGAKAWIDGIVAPAAIAVNSGDFGFWAEGAPTKLLASNFTSALDIWNTLRSVATLSGSMGELMNSLNNKLPANNFMGSSVSANLDDEINAIKAKTDNLPASPAPASEYDTEMARLDVAVSTRSGHSAADIWAVGTRTLTSFGSLVSDIWAAVTRTLTSGPKDSEIDSILADTDELQQNQVSWATADVSSLALEATAQSIKAKTDTIAWGDVQEILKLTGYKVTKSGDVITIYETDGTTVWRQYNLADGGRVQV